MFSALIHSEMLIEVLLDMENNDLVVFVKKIWKHINYEVWSEHSWYKVHHRQEGTSYWGWRYKVHHRQEGTSYWGWRYKVRHRQVTGAGD